MFVDQGEGSKEPFNRKDPITAGLQQLLLPFPGSFAKLNASDLNFVPLVRTGENTGNVPLSDIMQSEGGAAAAPAAHQYPITSWRPISAAS